MPWIERLIKTLTSRRLAVLLSPLTDKANISERMESFPASCQLPDEILLKDDGLQPLTIKLAPVDQALVSPTSEEEEKVGHDSPELTDQLLKLVEDCIIDRMKKKMEEIVIPEWKVKLVQSYDWPKYQ